MLRTSNPLHTNLIQNSTCLATENGTFISYEINLKNIMMLQIFLEEQGEYSIKLKKQNYFFRGSINYIFLMY